MAILTLNKSEKWKEALSTEVNIISGIIKKTLYLSFIWCNEGNL